MSSSDRRTLLTALAALPLAGLAAACGFAPVHAPGGAADGLHGAVRAAAPDSRDGFDFVQRLEERLGRPGPGTRFDLAYDITTNPVGAGITPAGAVTRYTLTGSATFRLTDTATGAERAAGRVESFTSWSTTGSTVATLAAEEDAHRRLMRVLADQVVTRLIAAGAG